MSKLSDIAAKTRFAELFFSEKKKRFLENANCKIWSDDDVKKTVLDAWNARPNQIPDFRRLAISMLGEEPLVLESLDITKPDVDTRRLIIENLVDAVFAECLMGCLIDVKWNV